MAETSPAGSRWAFRSIPPVPRSIVELISTGALDAGLGATLWLLVEARVPLLVVAATTGDGKTTLLRALLDFLLPEVVRVELNGSDETFEWLPQASELGWPGRARATAGAPVRSDTTMLVADELSDDLPSHVWGERARIAVRSTAIGYGLAATMPGDSLEEVFEALGRPPVSLSEDELSYLGCVLILRRVDRVRRRVVAAHYVRPFVRDTHGHTQRLGPAVLATWDPSRDAFEDFGWGVTPELAFRVGKRAGDFESEVERRRALLAGLADAGVTGVEEVRSALRRYLVGS